MQPDQIEAIITGSYSFLRAYPDRVNYYSGVIEAMQMLKELQKDNRQLNQHNSELFDHQIKLDTIILDLNNANEKLQKENAALRKGAETAEQLWVQETTPEALMEALSDLKKLWSSDEP